MFTTTHQGVCRCGCHNGTARHVAACSCERPRFPSIRFGTPHCCECAGVCHHIGPVRLCRKHDQRINEWIKRNHPITPQKENES